MALHSLWAWTTVKADPCECFHARLRDPHRWGPSCHPLRAAHASSHVSFLQLLPPQEPRDYLLVLVQGSLWPGTDSQHFHTLPREACIWSQANTEGQFGPADFRRLAVPNVAALSPACPSASAQPHSGPKPAAARAPSTTAAPGAQGLLKAPLSRPGASESLQELTPYNLLTKLSSPYFVLFFSP